MNEIAVDAKGLTKWYGDLKAVDNVSFQVKKGSSFGLLGLNGAGKTTTFKMMVSLIRPDSGTAKISGYDVVKDPMMVRSHIGYVAENPAFYTRMTTLETLLIFTMVSINSGAARSLSFIFSLLTNNGSCTKIAILFLWQHQLKSLHNHDTYIHSGQILPELFPGLELYLQWHCLLILPLPGWPLISVPGNPSPESKQLPGFGPFHRR
jgi:ABC-type branched-subunit amino acid transport system ATPase component